ncbi:MAG TPA: TMEM175 family protein [Gaiellaceae bacterium]
MATSPGELPLERLAAFSDAVFAIAITLLVLELGIDQHAGPHLLHSIVHEWPSYLAYVTSFLTIGVLWIQHSAIVGSIRVGDAGLYRLNLLVLLLASFLPFPTKLLAEFIGQRGPERVAAVFYGLTLLAISLSVNVFARYAAQLRALAPGDVETDTVRTLVRTPSLLLYGVGIGVSLLFPTAGVITYLASAIARGLPTDAVRSALGRA